MRRDVRIPLVADPGLTPTRRDLVKWLGASMALAASGCSRPPENRIYSYARSPEIEANGLPLYYASACVRAGHAQGVLVGTVQGRPVKVEGNPDHPASLGGTSVQAQAAVLQLWDPDRSTDVWLRESDGSAAPSTWQAFRSAWRQRDAAAPVHVLTPAFTSPTLATQLARLLQGRPGSRWYRDDGAASWAAMRGGELAYGRPVRLVHHFDRADVIIAIGGDPFSDPVSGTRLSAQWARARGAAVAKGQPPPRLVALETTPGLFGARADEREALAPHALEALVGTLAAPPQPSESGTAARLRTLLGRHQGRVIVWGGEALGAEAHASIHAINRACGAHEQCITAIEAPDRHAPLLPAPGSSAELADAARRGEVQTLLVLGSNPVYAAPTELGWAEALARVPFSVHLGLFRDETGVACRWHLPMGHDFEQWSDARAEDGTLTVMQPAIAPLYDTRSVHEVVAMLMPAPDVPDGHALVQAHSRETWRLEPAAFEARWRESLRRGWVEGSAALPLAGPLSPVPAIPARVAEPGAIWVVCPPDASVGDGDHANNGWLQELPRPFSKIAWGNALILGAGTARAHGLASGDVVRARGPKGVLEAPVWVDSRHAEGAATLHGGHGRRLAGRVGNGVGVDNAALRSADAVAVPVTLERLRGGHRFALTQVEHDPHGRELARTAPVAPAARPLPSLYPPEPPVAPTGPAWAMAIDLDACIGCNVCTIACQAENNIAVVGPEEVIAGRAMHWIRVDAWQQEDGRVESQPVPCMHCENAPCELVCPVGATVHDSEGLNLQVYNRCIGTRFCSNNCPYKVRRFNFRQYSDVRTETARLARNPDVTVRDRGVMEKCSYCVQRLSRARRETQRSGATLPTDTVETACQGACPTGAIHFGDLNDPHSDVVRAKASPRHYAMLEELGTRPRTTYLTRIAPRGRDDA